MSVNACHLSVLGTGVVASSTSLLVILFPYLLSLYYYEFTPCKQEVPCTVINDSPFPGQRAEDPRSARRLAGKTSLYDPSLFHLTNRSSRPSVVLSRFQVLIAAKPEERSSINHVVHALELFALVQEVCYVLIRCPAQRGHRKSSLKVNSWFLGSHTGITLHHEPHLEASTTTSHLYVRGISLVHSRSLVALT